MASNNGRQTALAHLGASLGLCVRAVQPLLHLPNRRGALQQDAHSALIPEALEIQLDTLLPDLQLARATLERV
jgi:hypothetical protein